MITKSTRQRIEADAEIFINKIMDRHGWAIHQDGLQNIYIAGATHWAEKCESLASAIKKRFPEALTCKHDFEPNTSMDYFRCEKCYIPSSYYQALKECEGEK